MSSHHIVREAQEPALIIANGEDCSQDLMNQLLEWSPTVMVLDGALERVLQLDIKIDIVLGDFDFQTIDTIKEKIQPHCKVIHTPNQDKTDLEKGIEYLIENGHKAVNIIWATGKRSDHAINNLAILARYFNQINLVMLDNYSKIYPLKSGFAKYYAQNISLSLIPLNKVEALKTENLVWNLNHETIEFPYSTSSSNRVAADGIVYIEFKSGILLMMECID